MADNWPAHDNDTVNRWLNCDLKHDLANIFGIFLMASAYRILNFVDVYIDNLCDLAQGSSAVL